jgi:hypothetical protein
MEAELKVSMEASGAGPRRFDAQDICGLRAVCGGPEQNIDFIKF